MDHTVFYKWEMGDAVLSISSSAEGTLISYGAGSLDARHEQEVKTKKKQRERDLHRTCEPWQSGLVES